MPTTALISAGVSAAGAVTGSLINANAAGTASAQQVAMQQQALAQQKALYEQGLSTQAGYFSTAQGALNPFINAGASVLPTLQGLITPGSNQNALLAQTPGFQFASQYGTKAATNALTASGRASGGPLATAVSQYNNGLAQNVWGNTVNALQGYASMGTNAAGALSSAAGSAGNAALNAGVTAGNSQASTLTGIGQAQAAGTLGQANALSSGVTGITSGANNALLYSQLFGNGNNNNGLYSPSSLSNGPSTSQANALVNGPQSAMDQYEALYG